MSQPITAFSSDKQDLSDLLKQLHEGKLQLPDFQRGWVWNDAHIVSLLASIGLSYPIGAIMTLETGNPDVRFQTRAVEGVRRSVLPPPEHLILDGQQRLTSLYQSLYSQEAVVTRDARNAEVKRFYYLDIKKALDDSADLDEAILSVPDDRKLRNFRGEVIVDYSTPALEYEHEMLPLNIVLDTARYSTWQMGYLQPAGGVQTTERWDRWNRLSQSMLGSILRYQIPIIELKRSTPKAAICQVFEKVNTGGVSLTVFELLTATFAIDDFNLRKDWEQRHAVLRQKRLLANVSSDYFLQAVSLLATYHGSAAVSCKRKDILRLELTDYLAWADAAQNGFLLAAKFLHTQHLFDPKDIPYQTQLVPLAVFLHLLGDAANTSGGQQKVRRWYWSGVLGELYGSAVETRFAKDVPEVTVWVNSGPEPTTVREANFYPDRLRSLRSRNSAAYKGIYALLMQQNPLDFRSGIAINAQTYFDEAIDIHHIFPKEWCKTQGIEAKQFDSITNKTPLSARTNRKIGGKAPSDYLARLRGESGSTDPATEQRRFVQSHRIDYDQLTTDAFADCMATREQTLLAIIADAMQKPTASLSGPPLSFVSQPMDT